MVDCYEIGPSNRLDEDIDKKLLRKRSLMHESLYPSYFMNNNHVFVNIWNIEEAQIIKNLSQSEYYL